MLTMGAYAPRANDGDALDGMALTLRGTRRWPRQGDLDALATLCSVSPEEKEEWYRRLQEAISSVSMSALEFCRRENYEPAPSRLGRMLELWSFGCANISPPASAVARDAALAMRTRGVASSLATADPDTIYNPPCAGTATTEIAAGKRSVSSGQSLQRG